MKKNTVHVLMAPDDDPTGEPVEIAVTAMLGDQMRAELEIKRRHQVTPEDAGINFVAAMTWAALAREGRITCKLDEFVLRVYDLDREEDDTAGDVDPTQSAASSDSASPSPSPSPAPASTGGSSESTPATTS